MAEGIASRLLEHADQDWSILEWLASLTEVQRRAVLRPHREAPFTTVEETETRRRVDDAVRRVMLLELGLEIGLPLPTHGPPALKSLLASSTFLRYIDAYLALSVRFVAERLEIPDPTPTRLNELPAAWPCPPPIPEAHVGHVNAAIEALLEMESRLREDADVEVALRFLDNDAGEHREGADGRPPVDRLQYELWLRRLAGAPDDRFLRITRGLISFARAKTAFYQTLERLVARAAPFDRGERGEWTARHPLTARFGLYDLHAFALLLRAEISPSGTVTFADGSWMKTIVTRAAEATPSLPNDALEQCDDVLRGVLDYACDLVQNAAEIACERLAVSQAHPPPRPLPAETVRWRSVYDEEIEEVEKQRGERRYAARLPGGAPAAGSRRVDRPPDSRGRGAARTRQLKSIWSRRVVTGEHLDDLVGLAFSGGGIRSATFNLGVLQRLQELDLLRHVDYLSTVSGGGYIGAWLLANVRRTRYWLTQPSDWSESIKHLRRFSNYLSPRTGLMSADTWTMWGSWIRNAVLIQFNTVVWLAFVMVMVLLGKLAFDWSDGSPAYGWLAVLLPAFLALVILWNIQDENHSHSERLVIWCAVLPAWLAAFFASSVFWTTAVANQPSYFDVLSHMYDEWWIPLAILGISYAVLSWVSAESRLEWRPFVTFLAAIFATAVVYLAVCAVHWMYRQWHSDDYVWYAYAFGPSLLLVALTLGVVLMIGMVGRASPDWRREWWTRFGSWMGIYGAGFIALVAVTVFGPLLLLKGVHAAPAIKWTTVLGWLGTVIGGLFAGNSTLPDADRARSWTARAVGIFARVAAIIFIAGGLVLVATLVHVVLVKISPSTNPINAEKYWANLALLGRGEYLGTAVVLLVVGFCCSLRFDLNVFGLNQFYRNRLVRCYLGATRWIPGLRRPHLFTGFDPGDELLLSDLRHVQTDDPPYRGPFPLVNCSLNLGGSSDLALHTRHSASFVMTPLRCGSNRAAIGYAPSLTANKSFAGGVRLGQAISISGAAASPNMGYDTSPLVAFLLTMFNVRLAWWFPNPGRAGWWLMSPPFSLWYLVRETFGLADENSHFVNVSDGGHFENLGIYELVRRRCEVIIAADAECDEGLAFGSLGRVVRMCQTDFGARIEIDVESIRRSKDSQRSRAHCTVGRITYANGRRGYLIYLKASMTGDEDIDVQQYHASHPAFPHETTADQFFAEDQFESYRTLGHHITELTFRGVESETSVVAMAKKLEYLWTPASAANVEFVDQTQALSELWDRMRKAPELLPLFRELHGIEINPTPHEPTEEELCICLELIQLMENAFLDLRLDEFWRHPDNQGWVVLFTMWAQSPTFRDAWRQYRNIFGIRFGYFCRQRLGL